MLNTISFDIESTERTRVQWTIQVKAREKRMECSVYLGTKFWINTAKYDICFLCFSIFNLKLLMFPATVFALFACHGRNFCNVILPSTQSQILLRHWWLKFTTSHSIFQYPLKCSESPNVSTVLPVFAIWVHIESIEGRYRPFWRRVFHNPYKFGDILRNATNLRRSSSI